MSTATLPARASLSPPLASSSSDFRLFVFPPVAPVVTRRPLELTGGRCHAAPGVLSRVPMFVGVSPLTCAAGGTWLGCRWRGLGDGAPRNGLESLVLLPGVAWVACLLQLTLELPLDSCGAHLYSTPPLPLSLYNRTCPDTLPTNGRVISWSFRSPSHRRFPLALDPLTY